jgi:hypothetical protein
MSKRLSIQVKITAYSKEHSDGHLFLLHFVSGKDRLGRHISRLLAAQGIVQKGDDV